MFPNNHLLILSQSDFLQRQLGAVLDQAEPAMPFSGSRFWRRAARRG